MRFEPKEIDQLADAVSEKVLERLRPLLANKSKGHDGGKIFTVETLSEYLHVPKSKIYNLVHLNEIPHVKVGRALRFRKSDIDSWLQETYTPALNGISNLFRGGVKK